MRFDELLHKEEVIRWIGPADTEVAGLTYKSRDVRPGWLFAAIPGSKVDGHTFIPEAIDAGASALIVNRDPGPLPGSVSTAVVGNPRKALARAAGRFFGHPSRRMKVIGITGTNGKTTTAFIIESILREGDHKPAVVGTINYRLGDTTHPATMTTPESVDLQRMLDEMNGMGADSAVIEVSSHAIHQGRIWGLEFAARLFTNLSRDHLDYHGTLEDYFEAKAGLFTDPEFSTSGPAVINIDDPWGVKLAGRVKDAITCGIENGDAIVNAAEWEATERGVSLKIVTPRWEETIHSPLLGRINVYNILAATGAVYAMGVDPRIIRRGVEALERVPGRLEPVLNDRGIHVLVDYSHTPDALEKAMLAVREFTPGKMFVVFGCGGDRDRGKRPIMGELAARLADAAIVTNDNPRTEEPLEIIAEILEGVAKTAAKKIEPRQYPNGVGNYWVESDRRKAIFQAVETAREGDSVLIAGKGHEDYQILGTEKIHFDDRETAREALGA